MKNRIYLSMVMMLVSMSGWTAPHHPFDPFFWMEEVDGSHARQWAQTQSDRTRAELEASPHFQGLYDDALAILLAKDRVPFSSFGKGYFWNFWQDRGNKQGVLRRTTFEEYRKDQPTWEVILDLDELSRKEGETWVYKGSASLSRTSSRRLVHLSRGGKDAVEIREYDFEKKEFVENGFFVAEAKSAVTPLDEDRVLVETDFGPGSMTRSGYPRFIKLWKRGEPLSSAQTILEASVDDMSVGAYVVEDEKTRHVFVTKTLDFFHKEEFLMEEEGRLRKLPIPSSASVVAYDKGFIYLHLKETAQEGERHFSENTILRYPLQDTDLSHAQVVFTPAERQSIESVHLDSGRMIVGLLDNVRSRYVRLEPTETGFAPAVDLPFPSTGILSVEWRDPRDPSDISIATYTDYLTPSSQYRVHDEDGSYRLELLKSAPSRFQSDGLEVVQHFAKSRDGTSVPYFVIKRKDVNFDGKNPTILYGYGGFEVSLTPSYKSVTGKLWLERGGVYVIANIRGGGEFGPEWHQAALKENRQRAFDDFISVAEDLISQKITSPRHLGIHGGSNGGLLVGAVMVQRPELFHAALVGVPLLDMVRYSQLLAGASWIGEYGDPSIEAECAKLLEYSPYHNVKPGQSYPRPFFTTSAADDRVHPAHARKMAARMIEQGHSVLFYESAAGGHGGSVPLEQRARDTAMEYTYMWERLK